MDWIERLLWLGMGGFMGFVLGYIVRSLRETKEEVDEIVELIKKSEEKDPPSRVQDERGSVTLSWAGRVGLFLVVALSVFASFQTSNINGQLKQTLACMTEYNTNQGKALNTRDRAVKTETQAGITLWTLYEKLYQIAKSDPKKIPIVQERLNKAIINYRDQLIRTQKIRKRFDYDDPDVLRDCESKHD